MRNKNPKEVIKTLFSALGNDDTETVKGTLSNRTIELIKTASNYQSTTFEEVLKMFRTQYSDLPKTRNQKINGDIAFIDVKNINTGEFEVFVFIKEDNFWKLAIDHIVLNVEMNKVERFFNNIKNLFGDCIDLLKAKT